MSQSTPISITAVRFTGNFDLVPRRIECDGVSYDLGAAYTKITMTTDDGGIADQFDVSDGVHRFRLRRELQQLQWWLVTMTSVKKTD